MKEVFKMTEADWFSLAMIIDNEFTGSGNMFTYVRKANYHYLSSNRCDSSSLIRVYSDFVTITKITRLGEDTDSWQEVTKATYKRINDYLKLYGFKQIELL